MVIFDDLPFRSYDVLIAQPNFVDNGSVEFVRMVEEHDDSVSLPRRNDTAGIAFPTRKFSWLLEGRADKNRFYRFLYRIRGRQKIMWVPTWRNDFEMIADIGVGSAQMQIKEIGLVRLGLDARNRFICFMMDDGTFKYRYIKNWQYVSAGVEKLIFDKPFYNGLQKSNVLMVCFMSLSRLDHDLIEIKHVTDKLATAVTVFKTVWNIRNV